MLGQPGGCKGEPEIVEMAVAVALAAERSERADRRVGDCEKMALRCGIGKVAGEPRNAYVR